ncbi:hypothetical protein [Actinomycetospora aeridis]|uniref:Small CPxCG-related zinc finger protein n=1 Tax=Actinomycetospora aeridis TaxID=3129231 RepID=A0ABU8N2J3_9PSEU
MIGTPIFDELMAFGALAQALPGEEPYEVPAEGDEVCDRCRCSMTSYVRVEHPEHPGQHDLVCPGCVREEVTA